MLYHYVRMLSHSYYPLCSLCYFMLVGRTYIGILQIRIKFRKVGSFHSYISIKLYIYLSYYYCEAKYLKTEWLKTTTVLLHFTYTVVKELVESAGLILLLFVALAEVR